MKVHNIVANKCQRSYQGIISLRWLSSDWPKYSAKADALKLVRRVVLFTRAVAKIIVKQIKMNSTYLEMTKYLMTDLL